MSLLSCPQCGRDNDGSFAYCQGCGQSLRPSGDAATRCPTCQAPIDGGQRFCVHCGRSLEPAGPATTPPPILNRIRHGRSQAAAVAVPAPVAAPVPPPVRVPPPAPVLEAPRHEPVRQVPPPAPTARHGGARLVPMRQDGLPGTVVPIGEEPIVCGRTSGQLRFDDDPTVSPEHARFEFRGETLYAEDLGSLNGTFVRLRGPRPLLAGDEIRIGRQLLRVDPMPHPIEGTGARPWGSTDAGYRARLVQLLEGGGTGEVFPLLLGENTIGREVARVCFPADRFVSAKHARIDVATTGMMLSDVGSSNGTFLRIAAPEPLAPGDQVLVGLQLIRVE